MTLLSGLKISDNDDDDALISDDYNDSPLIASTVKIADSNNSDITWDINAIFFTDDDDICLPSATATTMATATAMAK